MDVEEEVEEGDATWKWSDRRKVRFTEIDTVIRDPNSITKSEQRAGFWTEDEKNRFLIASEYEDGRAEADGISWREWKSESNFEGRFDEHDVFVGERNGWWRGGEGQYNSLTDDEYVGFDEEVEWKRQRLEEEFQVMYEECLEYACNMHA
jgi:hypothetical protein